MVISDFNLICLGQNKSVKYRDKYIGTDCVIPGNINKKSTYGQDWNILTAFNGIWYDIYPITGSEYDYEKGFFDLNTKAKRDNQLANSLNEKDSYLSCEKLSCEKLMKLIDFYVDLSPLKKICVMFGLNRNLEAITGVMSTREFYEKLQSNEINFDIIYVISK